MRIAIDTGGTFTDCVFLRDGKLEILKSPSQPKNPAAAIGAALSEMRANLGAQAADGLDLICGTTVGTNALLERRGGRVLLITTEGFEDVLEIGRQARAKLYNLQFHKAPPIVPRERRIGARERLAADGSIILALNKWDLLTEKDTAAGARFERTVREQMKFLSWAPVLTLSALTGQRVRKLLAIATRANARRSLT